jgi:hypothetical protein
MTKQEMLDKKLDVLDTKTSLPYYDYNEAVFDIIYSVIASDTDPSYLFKLREILSDRQRRYSNIVARLDRQSCQGIRRSMLVSLWEYATRCNAAKQ